MENNYLIVNNSIEEYKPNEERNDKSFIRKFIIIDFIQDVSIDKRGFLCITYRSKWCKSAGREYISLRDYSMAYDFETVIEVNNRYFKHFIVISKLNK